MAENGQEVENKDNFYEVMTDEAKVIGKSDPGIGLEAVPIGCGLTIFTDKDKRIAGMIHSSLGITVEKAEELVADITWGFKAKGGDIKKAQITGIKLGKTNEKAIKQGLERVAKITTDFPNNLLNSDGVRVRKNGEIEEFNFPH